MVRVEEEGQLIQPEGSRFQQGSVTSFIYHGMVECHFDRSSLGVVFTSKLC